jgi:ubiquinone/menaquinone biosynthesis C-methylase UbiE
MNEKEKYVEIYSGNIGKDYENIHGEGYGRGFWGENAVSFIFDEKPKSVCDVGCGYGRFCNAISEFVDEVYGADIASVATGNVIDNKKIKYIDCEAKKIPLEDKSVDWVTSFDCLEHCLPEDIDIILDELNRVTKKGFVLSISYVDDSHKHERNTLILHMTVEKEEWWLDKISKYGEIHRGDFIGTSDVRYIILRKK